MRAAADPTGIRELLRAPRLRSHRDRREAACRRGSLPPGSAESRMRAGPDPTGIGGKRQAGEPRSHRDPAIVARAAAPLPPGSMETDVPEAGSGIFCAR